MQKNTKSKGKDEISVPDTTLLMQNLSMNEPKPVFSFGTSGDHVFPALGESQTISPQKICTYKGVDLYPVQPSSSVQPSVAQTQLPTSVPVPLVAKAGATIPTSPVTTTALVTIKKKQKPLKVFPKGSSLFRAIVQEIPVAVQEGEQVEEYADLAATFGRKTKSCGLGPALHPLGKLIRDLMVSNAVVAAYERCVVEFPSATVIKIYVPYDHGRLAGLVRTVKRTLSGLKQVKHRLSPDIQIFSDGIKGDMVAEDLGRRVSSRELPVDKFAHALLYFDVYEGISGALSPLDVVNHFKKILLTSRSSKLGFWCGNVFKGVGGCAAGQAYFRHSLGNLSGVPGSNRSWLHGVNYPMFVFKTDGSSAIKKHRVPTWIEWGVQIPVKIADEQEVFISSSIYTGHEDKNLYSVNLSVVRKLDVINVSPIGGMIVDKDVPRSIGLGINFKDRKPVWRGAFDDLSPHMALLGSNARIANSTLVKVERFMQTVPGYCSFKKLFAEKAAMISLNTVVCLNYLPTASHVPLMEQLDNSVGFWKERARSVYRRVDFQADFRIRFWLLTLAVMYLFYLLTSPVAKYNTPIQAQLQADSYLSGVQAYFRCAFATQFNGFMGIDLAISCGVTPTSVLPFIVSITIAMCTFMYVVVYGVIGAGAVWSKQPVVSALVEELMFFFFPMLRVGVIAWHLWRREYSSSLVVCLGYFMPLLHVAFNCFSDRKACRLASDFIERYESADPTTCWDLVGDAPLTIGKRLLTRNCHDDLLYLDLEDECSFSILDSSGQPLEPRDIPPQPRQAVITPMIITNGLLYAPTPGAHTMICAIISRNLSPLTYTFTSDIEKYIVLSGHLGIIMLKNLNYSLDILSDEAWCDDFPIHLIDLVPGFKTWISKYNNLRRKTLYKTSNSKQKIEMEEPFDVLKCTSEVIEEYLKYTYNSVHAGHHGAIPKAGASPLGETIKLWKYEENLTSGVKARSIISCCPTMLALLQGPSRFAAKMLHGSDGIVQHIDGNKFRFTYAGGAQGCDYSAWLVTAQSSPDIIDILYGGDDSAISYQSRLWKLDYVHFDHSQKEPHIDAELKWWSVILPKVLKVSVGKLLKRAYSMPVIFKRRGTLNREKLRVMFKTESRKRRITGLSTTSVATSYSNLLVVVAVSVATTKDEKKFLDFKEFNKLGIEVSGGECTIDELDFFSGRFWLMEDGSREWGWLVTSALKMGKTLCPLKTKKALLQQAFSVGKSTGLAGKGIPIISKMAETMIRLGEGSEYVPPLWAPYRPKSYSDKRVNKVAAYEWMESRYGISKDEVLECESVLDSITSLPYLICHAAFAKLAYAVHE
jgi:hypothetical protein